MILSKDHQRMIDDLLAVEEGMTDWECRFVEDISKHVFELTENQAFKLNQIWMKLCGDTHTSNAVEDNK